jgi:hypothetical protein
MILITRAQAVAITTAKSLFLGMKRDLFICQDQSKKKYNNNKSRFSLPPLPTGGSPRLSRGGCSRMNVCRPPEGPNARIRRMNTLAVLTTLSLRTRSLQASGRALAYARDRYDDRHVSGVLKRFSVCRRSKLREQSKRHSNIGFSWF